MKNRDKINFLKSLSSVLLKRADIKKEVLDKVNEKLQDKNIEEIEKIVFDLFEGLESNENLLKEVINLENIKINDIVKKFNEKLPQNPSANLNITDDINQKHYNLIKFLAKEGILDKEVSETYIDKMLNTVVNFQNDSNFWNYYNNPGNQKYQYRLYNAFFTEDNLVSLFFIHFLNLYENQEERYINQIQNSLKISIALYISISQRVSQVKKLLIPFSIISIFADLYNQSIQINRIGRINIVQMFQIIFQNESLNIYIIENLKELKELNLIYDLLIDLEEKQVDKSFTIKILKNIIEQSLYDNKLLINFNTLFSNNVKEDYEEVINKKLEENKHWYKELILNNILSDNEILHNKAIEFLLFVNNWYEDKELREILKGFLKKNIDKIFNSDEVYNLLKIFVEKGEELKINYTILGRVLIDKFINLENEDEKIDYIFKNIERIYKEKDLKDYFIPNLLDKTILNLRNISESQINILNNSKFILQNIEESKIKELFRKVIDERTNKNVFSLLNLILCNNKLDKEIKKEFKEKLEEIREKIETDEMKKIINEIINNCITNN
ncbi:MULTISPECIES: hypothetical protein [unclassified Nitratiruptor]|uniref:hypothetical protein n=1 Tax=unclassified Nitratiruptor TaxID=2624044 RepID=UPI001916B0D0|nr:MULTISPECIES: hypothetical protein [unclassified Nitratiruptor]BCD60392.1 hypothetical protein NitYY0810_C1157 [Nitratiruptor sp. YY08-10]BCD64119.1 hypothetical protein NitYY0814_C0964 [Nitratiruptor sp. YY08-14]